MKMSKVLFAISFIMILIGILFVMFALNHPEGFIVVPIIGATGLYIIYSIVAIGMLAISKLIKGKN